MGPERQKKGGRSRQRFCSSLPAREATVIGILAGIKALFQSTLPAREATHVIKKEAVTPTTGKPVEDLQGPNASYTVSVTDALTGVKDRKGPLRCRKKEAEAAKGSASFLKTYQESQRSQTG